MRTSSIIDLDERDRFNVKEITVQVPGKTNEIILDVKWELCITMSKLQLLDLGLKIQSVINQINKENREKNAINI